MNEIVFAEGRFSFDAPHGACEGGEPSFQASSGAKWAYRGRYWSHSSDGGQGVPAIAVYSCRNNETCLKREMAALGQGEHRGFGPKLLANADAERPDDAEGQKLAVAIEEDAGVSLAQAIAGTPIPGAFEQTLLPADTAEGERQTAKILFDVTCQVANMHRCGLFHHDLKSSNVCVRSIGERPWDVRATLIDFDHAMHESDGLHVQSTPAYHDLLFRDLAISALPTGYVPSSMERDLGCLAIVWCEVAARKELRYSRLKRSYSLNDDELSYALGRKNPFFWYEQGMPRARKLDFYSDVAVFAEQAMLVSAEELALPFDVQRQASLFKCGEYFDCECMDNLKRAHEDNLGAMEDSIARAIFKHYNEHLAQDGCQVKYLDFDDQPPQARASNYAQAASFVANIWRLGLEIVSSERARQDELVREFTDSQMDQLARWEHERWCEERLELGWTYGATPDGRSDFGRRVSPSLVAYDELPAAMREYDALPMRQMISILRSKGLGLRYRR